MAVLWLGAAAISTSVMQQKLLEVYDESLRQNAQGLLALAVHEFREEDEEAAELVVGRRSVRPGDDSDEEHLPAGHDSSFTYVIRGPAGETVLRDEQAPASLDGLQAGDGFGELNGRRLFVLTDRPSDFSILVLETSDRRAVALRDSLAVLVTPLLALVPLIIVGVWFTTRQTLRPLERLRREIAERHSRNLAPVGAEGHPVELAPIAGAVGALLSRLKAALDAERAFAARSAHELRTPLAGALAQVQQLHTELKDANARGRLAQVEASLARLSGLSDRLLQLGRIEAGFVRTETEVDLLPALRITIRDFNASAAWPDRVVLEPADPARLAAPIDADAFAMVMRNLIENGLKHGAPGRPVRVTVSGDACSIRIANEGPVLPAAELAALGKPFVRGATIAEGSGLGLSIVRGILEQAGGSLELRSPASGESGGVEAVVRLAQ
jgi:two-component system OmpR family sensor kinase